ncbi:P-loop containing nucleoside triphosphate hydrolase protein [Phycomyces nitens]|nr:P-loop containing nucleoside triphosphate hydrolase protein [Phycomyces nitens]
MVLVYTIGISGPSCSGKTTLTRILQKILKNSVVIYQDDFFKPDDKIPIDPETKLANWDCPDALDTDGLVALIQYARNHDGQLPKDYRSNEINNVHDGSNQVSPEILKTFESALEKVNTRDSHFVLVDGFMLYWDTALCAELDARIFTTASYDILKHRRENRQGYNTAEGYWVDPPGYFDAIVWPQFVHWNKHLFVGKDHSEVDHKVVEDVLVIDTDEYSIKDSARMIVNKLVETFESSC